MPVDPHCRQQQQIAVIKVEIPIQKPVQIYLFGNLHCQKYLHDISHQHPCHCTGRNQRRQLFRSAPEQKHQPDDSHQNRQPERKCMCRVDQIMFLKSICRLVIILSAIFKPNTQQKNILCCTNSHGKSGKQSGSQFSPAAALRKKVPQIQCSQRKRRYKQQCPKQKSFQLHS